MAKEAIELYLESLRAHRDAEKEGFRFSWEGELSELKEEYTSVELQHKALEWREDN